MNSKILGWIFTLTGLFLMIGVVLPNLFSAKSDLAIFAGWALSILTLYFIIDKVRGIIKWIKTLN